MTAFSTKEIKEAKEFIRTAATGLDTDWSFFQDETVATDLDHLAWIATLMDSVGIDGTESVWMNQDLFLSFKSEGADKMVGFALHMEAQSAA